MFPLNGPGKLLIISCVENRKTVKLLQWCNFALSVVVLLLSVYRSLLPDGRIERFVGFLSTATLDSGQKLVKSSTFFLKKYIHCRLQGPAMWQCSSMTGTYKGRPHYNPR